ncbi:MAG: zinc-ribbon domain-containing protein [Lachnospiraceae bacterium]|nr:zinc-ribbon domain-containing protein [Lachnospiraceae bacterium]
MALFKCPDCGKEISDRASACPNCGCPISEMKTGGIVKIKMPTTNAISGGFVGMLSSKNVTISSGSRTLWTGRHGQTASFELDAPTTITIDLGGWANKVNGRVEPKKKYELVQDQGIHMLATFTLSEVDVIDSGI